MTATGWVETEYTVRVVGPFELHVEPAEYMPMILYRAWAVSVEGGWSVVPKRSGFVDPARAKAWVEREVRTVAACILADLGSEPETKAGVPR
jgi:hypothetical protein